MKTIAFAEGGFEVDAAVVADGLGIAPAELLGGMRDGSITSRCEKGEGGDRGHFRLTFFSANRRFRLVCRGDGEIVQRSSVDFGARPLPPSARRPGG